MVLAEISPTDSHLGVASNALDSYENELEAERKENVKNAALLLGADWLEASSGEPIGREEYDRLFEARYVSYPSSEILERGFADGEGPIFNSWEEYQKEAQKSYVQRQEEKEAKEARLLAAIEKEREEGLVHSDFFSHVERHSVNNPGPKNKKLPRYIVTGKKARPEVILQRYFRYQLINHILRSYPRLDKTGNADPVDKQRIIDISMGFNAETGTATGTVKAGLKKTASSLTERMIDLAVEDLDIYNYIYPRSQKHHLRTLLEKAGKIKPRKTKTKATPEYQPERKTVTALGRTAVGVI
jgi:hypothetical protein